MIMEEIWKPVVGWEGLYEVSNMGRVKSLPRFHNAIHPYTSKEKILQPRGKSKNGEYLSVSLYNNYHIKQKRVHVLVAEAFIPNPNGYKEINHKNEIKSDNRAENLEWCDRSYNVTYNGLGKRRMAWRKKKIAAFDENGNLIKQFDSIDEASCWAKVDASNVSRAVNYGRKTAGFYWKNIE